MMDATIGCWDAKLFYWLIRPWKAELTAHGQTEGGRITSGRPWLFAPEVTAVS